ncbi:MAG: hypothetical protein Q9221_008591 [Calogaya cf. arnoldii]
MRTMLETHPLYSRSVENLLFRENKWAYIVPVAKTAEIANILCLGMFNVHTMDIGVSSIAMSDKTLNSQNSSIHFACCFWSNEPRDTCAETDGVENDIGPEIDMDDDTHSLRGAEDAKI